MDPVTARMKCLRLAAQNAVTEGKSGDASKILETARTWSEFVIGEKHIESKSQAKKGADDPK